MDSPEDHRSKSNQNPNQIPSYIAQSTVSLIEASRRRDVLAAERLYQKSYEIIGNPRLLIESASPGTVSILRAWFEVWDDILQFWWAARDGDKVMWRKIVTPRKDGWNLPLLSMNARWLREVQSDRIDIAIHVDTLEFLSELTAEEQAKTLIRYCAHCDSGTPLPYKDIAKILSPRWRAYFTNWFLSTYLMSPLSNMNAQATTNRENACREFISFHDLHTVRVPPSTLLMGSIYRSTYSAGDSTRFIESAAELMGRSFKPVLSKSRSSSPIKRRAKSTPRIGIVLTVLQ